MRPAVSFRRMLGVASAVAIVTGLPIKSSAQQSGGGADALAVKAAIDRLFDGMRRGDTAAMRAEMAPQARMMGISRDGQLNVNPTDNWLASVGRQPAGTVLNERTWDHEIRVDGNIAQAWMQYDFHVGERFSHCGVNAFTLVRLGDAWKVASVIDTRRTTGCATPPASAGRE